MPLRFWVLGSGSRGNATVVEGGGVRLLIDDGFSSRSLLKRLSTAGIEAESISAMLLTHEHGDHVCGAVSAAARWGWRVYATAGTIAGTANLPDSACEAVTAGERYEIGGLTVAPFAVPHDAAEPAGFVVTDKPSGARFGITTDLGMATDAVIASLSDLDMLVVESNHDSQMLRMGPYPRLVQDRIASPSGHLSNHDSGRLIQAVSHKSLGHVVLAHLSQNCNTPELAIATASAALRRVRHRGRVHAASQGEVLGPIAIGDTDRAQISLWA